MGEGGSEADGQEPGPATKPPGYWTLERCVEAVEKYFDDPALIGNPSQARYGAWAVGRPDAPSPSAFARYGGWTVVSKLARLRGPLPPEPHGPIRRHEQNEAAVLARLDEQGRIKNADIQALLGISEHRARHLLTSLRERGVITLGSKHATGRSVFYVRGAE